MSTIPHRPDAPTAKGIPQRDDDVGRRLDELSPSLVREVGRSLERILVREKAEALAADCDRKRSTIYRWAAKPEDVPISVLPILAAHDPDPEMLARVAGHLLTVVSARALARQVAGASVTIVQEIAPGKWGR